MVLCGAEQLVDMHPFARSAGISEIQENPPRRLTTPLAMACGSRASGGGPKAYLAALKNIEWFPRERGWSWQQRSLDRRAAVVPVQAGLIPSLTLSQRLRPVLPRARRCPMASRLSPKRPSWNISATQTDRSRSTRPSPRCARSVIAAEFTSVLRMTRRPEGARTVRQLLEAGACSRHRHRRHGSPSPTHGKIDHPRSRAPAPLLISGRRGVRAEYRRAHQRSPGIFPRFPARTERAP